MSSPDGKDGILPGRTGRQPRLCPRGFPPFPACPARRRTPAPAGQAPAPGGRSAHALGPDPATPARPPHRTGGCPSPGPQIPPPWELRWHPHLQARAARPSDFCSIHPRCLCGQLSSAPYYRHGEFSPEHGSAFRQATWVSASWLHHS